MIAAHLVWGVTLAWLTEVLLAESRRGSPRPFSSMAQPHEDAA